MNKPIFKIVDQRGRITLPKSLREQYAIDGGDIVSLKVDAGKIAVTKAIVLEDNVIPLAAKADYVRAVLKELTPDQLADILEHAVKLLKPLCPPF